MEQIRELLAAEKPIKWLFTGDSITHGAVHTFGWRDYSELFSERVRTELGRTYDVVLKTAMDGRSTAAILEHFDWNVGQFAPNVVFVMLGMNDCSTDREISPAQFAENLQRIVDRVRETPGSIPVLQTTCAIVAELAASRGENLPVYMDVVREVAARSNAPLIDHTRYWEEKIAAKPQLKQYWLSDPFHPNQWGHQVFAELIYKELGIFDEEAASCRLFRP